MIPCKFFPQGRCTFGASCKNFHEAAEQLQPGLAFRLPPSSTGTKSEIPVVCPYFVRGLCKYGTYCRLPHDSLKPQAEDFVQAFSNISLPKHATEDSSLSTDLKLTWRPEAPVFKPGSNISYEVSRKNDELGDIGTAFKDTVIEHTSSDDRIPKEINGAIAHFKSGAEVAQIQLSSDFSTIQIEGLKAINGKETVSQLVSSLGFTVPESAALLRRLGEDTTVAEVKAEDPKFAQLVIRNLEAQQGKGAFTTFTIKPVVRAGSEGASGNRLQLSTVVCTWYQASRMAWLSYFSRQNADKAKSALETRVIHQRTPECHIQISYQGYRSVRGNCTLQVLNLHGKTTERDLRHLLAGDLAPDDIKLGRPTHPLSDSKSADVVEALLNDFQGLESFQSSVKERSSKMTAKASFSERAKAADVVRNLNNTNVPGLGNTKILVQHVISVKYNVLNPILKVLQTEIDNLQDRLWKKSYVGLKMYPQTDLQKPFTTLRISGGTLKSVAEAKAALEKIVEGEVLLQGDLPLWDPYFLEPGAVVYLNEIGNRFGIYIHRNTRKSQLVGYATSQELLDEAGKVLIDQIALLQSTSHTITLSPDILKNAMQGGMQRLKARFGAAAVLNVSANPKTIAIVGSKADLEEAHALLGSTSLAINDATEPAGECVACWCTEPDSLKTVCGHIYCRECFSNQTSSKDSIPVRCFGNESQCNYIFGINELKSMLSHAEFEELLRKSFDNFIRSRPEKFQYCPTPDCPQIYRRTTEGDVFLCSTCLSPICTTCRVISHDGMTCEEYKDLSSEDTKAFQRYKKENDVRDCPKCKVGIQKTYGCNHMECTNCHIHICWGCMELFETGNQCYDHMSKSHGTFGQ